MLRRSLALAVRSSPRPAARLRPDAAAAGAPRRFLNLHEYQSKALMASFGVRVQRGDVANSPDRAVQVAQHLLKESPDAELVIKAQIHAGGRGKGHFDNGFKGGVQLSRDPKQIGDYARKMIGSRLITKQTGAEGQQCQLVLVHEAIQFERELYFAILMDRAYGGPVMVASKRGGMDIEEVAAESPGDIYSEAIDILKGLGAEQAKKMALRLGFEGAQADDAADQMVKLYRLFIERDATQVEINPFVVATNGKVYCVDAKINFDDNAAFRQQALFAMRDKSMEDPREVAASEHSLNYIGLDGNIGCMVNGAGLAMATMDIIKLHGGLPANFLDVGGGANEQQVEEAFKILTKDPRVKAILVNIFGGIMKCDIIATGIVNAARKIHLKHPLVVRLAGTNVELGNKILRDSGLSAITASNLDDAAKKAVLALSAAGKP